MYSGSALFSYSLAQKAMNMIYTGHRFRVKLQNHRNAAASAIDYQSLQGH